MNLTEEILAGRSKGQVEMIRDFIGKSSDRFGVLMEFVLQGPTETREYAAWIMNHCADRFPALLKPYIGEMVVELGRKECTTALKRNFLRALSSQAIPDGNLGPLVDVSFKCLQSPKQPVAVKVHAMTVLYRATVAIPEIRHELAIIIEDQMPYGSAGFRSRGSKILAALQTR